MGAVVLDVSVSLDGFATGPDPRHGAPLGDGGERLHEWMFGSPDIPGGPGGHPDTSEHGDASGHGELAGVNDAVVKELNDATGAVLMGRRIFDLGVGLWGDTPFPVPCFVLTHRPHEDMVMTSGTFTFVTAGLATALERARAAAGGRNVLALSPDVAQQLLRDGLVDEIQLHLVPVLLGSGRRLFDHLGEASHDLELTGVIEAPGVTHVRYRRPR
jgi:dihydrofolate reductase